MEILTSLFLATFSIARGATAAGLADLRIHREIRAADVTAVVERSGECKSFYRHLDEYFGDAGPEAGSWTLGGGAEETARHELRKITSHFMTVSYLYVVLYMKGHCESALKRLDDVAATRRSISFAVCRDYCVFTALHDFGYRNRLVNVDLLFENLFLLQTVTGNEGYYPLDYLKSELHRYVWEYQEILNRVKNSGLLRIDPMELDSEPNANEAEVTALMSAFCVSYRPFVGRDLLVDVQIKSQFIRYVFQKEICMLNFSQHYDTANSQQIRIEKWMCEIALETEEYGLQNYKYDLLAQTGLLVETNDQLKRVPDGSVGELYVEFTLDSLKYRLTADRHYLNYVQYYNVASEIALFAAIKEGAKVLRGIRHKAAIRCAAVSETAGAGAEAEVDAAVAGELRRFGTILRGFNRNLDALVVSVEEKRRVRVADKPAREAFAARATTAASLLSDVPARPERDRLRRACGEIANALAGVRGDVYLGGAADAYDESIAKRFEQYYFSGPSRHVDELYYFNEHDYTEREVVIVS